MTSANYPISYWPCLVPQRIFQINWNKKMMPETLFLFNFKVLNCVASGKLVCELFLRLVQQEKQEWMWDWLKIFKKSQSGRENISIIMHWCRKIPPLGQKPCFWRIILVLGWNFLAPHRYIIEPRHDKTNKMSVHPVWSESSLCAQWVAKDPRFLHADSEDSDQNGQMPRLIWVFAGRTLTLLVLSCRGSY